MASEEVFEGIFDAWFKVNEDEYITREDGTVFRYAGGDFDSVKVKGLYFMMYEKKVVTVVGPDHVPVFLLLARALTHQGLIMKEVELLFEPERKVFCFVEHVFPDGVFGNRKCLVCDRDEDKTKRHFRKSDIVLFGEVVKRYITGDEGKGRCREIIEEVEW